jgi:TctA family transporter
MAVVLTLPFTFGMPPVEGLSTMIGVYVGALTGGLFACALIGIPGTPSAIATTFDAFPMARAGRPGLALGIGIWASFFAGIISGVLLAILAPTLAAIGLEFGPWDYFMLIAFSLTMAASLSGEDMVKGLIAGVAGLLLACVGEDEINGVARFTYGIDALKSGFDFLPVLVGLFAFSQLLTDLSDTEAAKVPMLPKGSKAARVDHRGGIFESLRYWPSLIRSTLIGLFVGILPAIGGSISNILAWDQEKKASPHPEQFGTGIPQGVIASEAANNSTAGGALITLMALGIPFFGILGYVMMLLHFPLAPMILGVVLGPVAETNLSRSLATSDDLSQFFTRSWALFFLVLALFSVFFPWYQSARGRARWADFYMPVLSVVIAAPLFMMDGWFRPALGAALVILGAWLIWRRLARRGEV